jgi:predicted acylesterase/phospholipase RssA
MLIVLIGVSAGALNGVILGCHSPGDEEAALETLLPLWQGIQKEDIMTNWKMGLMEGLLWRRGLYDTTPEIDLLTRTLSKYDSLKRKVGWGIVDATTGS